MEALISSIIVNSEGVNHGAVRVAFDTERHFIEPAIIAASREARQSGSLAFSVGGLAFARSSQSLSFTVVTIDDDQATLSASCRHDDAARAAQSILAVAQSVRVVTVRDDNGCGWVFERVESFAGAPAQARTVCRLPL